MVEVIMTELIQRKKSHISVVPFFLSLSLSKE